MSDPPPNRNQVGGAGKVLSKLQRLSEQKRHPTAREQLTDATAMTAMYCNNESGAPKSVASAVQPTRQAAGLTLAPLQRRAFS
jgi:hypothetical protein